MDKISGGKKYQVKTEHIIITCMYLIIDVQMYDRCSKYLAFDINYNG